MSTPKRMPSCTPLPPSYPFAYAYANAKKPTSDPPNAIGRSPFWSASGRMTDAYWR